MFRVALIIVIAFLWIQKIYSQEIDVFEGLELDSIPSERQLNGLMAALEDSSLYVRIAALNRLLDSPWKGKIPENRLPLIASQIDTNQIELTRSAVFVLGAQESLSDNYLVKIATLLKNENKYIRNSAVSALEGQESLSDYYLVQIATSLKDEDIYIRRNALSVLEAQESLSDHYLIQIATSLKDEDTDVRRSALSALEAQKSLSDHYLGQIAALLKDEDAYVRRAALSALGAQKSLSDHYLGQIVALLKDEDTYVRQSALSALGAQESLSDHYLDQIVTLFKDENFYVRSAAISALRAQESLPEHYLIQIVTSLKDEHPYVCQSAVSVLETQESLSDKILIQIAVLLKDENARSRYFAASALGTQESLSEHYLIQVAALLKDENADVRQSAIKALRTQELLSEHYLIQITTLLKDENLRVRRSAISALETQESLSEHYLIQVDALLKDEDPDVRRSAVEALEIQKSLSEHYLIQVAALLKDENTKVRSSAVSTLRTQESLSDHYLVQVATLLKDEDIYVRWAAISTLRAQESLPEHYLVQIATLLKDENLRVRRSAWRSLYSETESIWYYALPFVINHAFVKDEEDRIEGTHQSRVPLYEVFGGNDSLTNLLKWLCRPSEYPSKIPIQEARITLELIIGLKDYMEDNPLFSAELGDVLPKLIRVVESQWSLVDIENLEEAWLITKRENPEGAVYIQERINKLKSQRLLNRFCGIIGIHFLVWALLFIIYPYIPTVRKAFFWNPLVRKWGGLGYVGHLISWIPFLRRHLFIPYKDMLLSEAFPNNWQKEEYFPDSRVYSIKERMVLPIAEALSSFRGQIILQGESGLGKTMFLRNLASSSNKIFVYLPASKCTQGLIKAINQKVPEAAADPAFLQQLVYAGSIDILIDGLNEISARAHAQLTNEIERYFKGNLLLTTQPMEWEPPAMAQIFRLQPLTEEQIEDFLLSRYPYLDQEGLLPQSAYLKNSSSYLQHAFDSELDTESLKSNLLTLSNPMDLALVSLLIARGENPSLLDLQEQQYKLMADAYKYNNLSNEFPLSKFSSVVYQMRVDDQPEIPADQFEKEILAMQRWKMVISRQMYRDNQEKPSKHWYFRHDKIMDYFLVQEFLIHPELCEKHLDDPRFRGVYFLLAFKLEYEDAMSLRERIIQHAADTKDHSLSDNFIQLIRGRRKPRKKVLETFREDILNAIAYGKSDKVIQLLRTHANGTHEQTVALLMSRQKELRRKVIEGTISSEMAQLERNKINSDIVDLAHLID